MTPELPEPVEAADRTAHPAAAAANLVCPAGRGRGSAHGTGEVNLSRRLFDMP